VAVEVELAPPPGCDADARGEWATLPLPGGAPPPDAAELDGGGLAVADFDGDGAADVFLARAGGAGLVLGSPDGPVDASDHLAGLELAGAAAVVVADVEGDGDLDVLLTRWQRPLVLLANDGGGRFVDVTARAGLGGTTDRHQGAAFADADRDGDLDLFVGSYGPQPSDDFAFDDPDLPPSPDRKHLFVQVAPGRFVEHSGLLPADLHDGYTFSATWLDTSGDGFPELFVWNDFGAAHPSRALTNEAGGGFTDVPGTTGVDRPFEDMGVAVGDLDRDGLPDFATTSFRRLGLLESAAREGGPGAVWIDGAAARGLDVSGPQEFGWGAEFGDLDHDRDEDLVAVYGYWSRYDGTPLAQPDGVWLHGEDGAFTQVAREWGLDDRGVGRGLVVGDVDGDGFLELVKRPLDGPATVASAGCDGSAWLEVDLRQASADTRALGARITAISADGVRQSRWVRAGSSSMYSSAALPQHFGLADDAVVDLEVRWPDGASSVLRDVPTRRRVTVTRR
jgi:hypothetical protein